MTSSLFGAVAPGISAGEAIAKTLDHLVDVALFVFLGIAVLWAAAATIVVVRDRLRNRTVVKEHGDASSRREADFIRH